MNRMNGSFYDPSAQKKRRSVAGRETKEVRRVSVYFRNIPNSFEQLSLEMNVPCPGMRVWRPFKHGRGEEGGGGVSMRGLVIM